MCGIRKDSGSMKVGLLPLYISQYDKTSPHLRERMGVFYEKIAVMLEERGVKVVRSPICTEEEQFEKEVATYEESGCDAIVTLHLAYSPGLYSEQALKNTKLPIIVCDTTETFDFSDEQLSSEVMYCHGIHGVMDMCNLLKKNGKPYAIAAGHFEKSDVIDRVVGFVKAAVAANSLRGSRVGAVGGFFPGMGDFRVSEENMLKTFDVTVVHPEKGEFTALAASVTEEEIAAEKARNEAELTFLEEVDEAVYTNSVTADLTLKKWIQSKGLQAFTINFRDIEELPTMPFNGICRSMSEGVGYAGEGDTLTALFTGALLQSYADTSFIEIFCPDWEHNTLFISHFCEMNYAVADKKPTAYTKKFTFSDRPDPIAASAAYKPGNGVFLNVYEDENGFNAFIAPVKVVQEKTAHFRKSIRGWLDFSRPISEVLEKISRCGATHHSIMVYDARPEEIEFFAASLGLKTYML